MILYRGVSFFIVDKQKVAFRAYPSKNLQNIPKHTKIVFGSVQTNIGNAYFPASGMFLCPDSAVYVFSWTIRSAVSGTRVEARLVRQGSEHKVGPTTPVPSSPTSSTTSVVQCEPGVGIWVQAVGWPEGNPVNAFHGLWTTFSGFRLEG